MFFFQAEDGIRDIGVTGVQTCALPISGASLDERKILPVSPKVSMCWMFRRYPLSSRETLWSCAIIIAFALINIAFLARATWTYSWIQDGAGNIIPADFVSFWSTSRMLQTAPAYEVYDWALHHAAEAQV